jgi:hypothetical protein
MWPGSSKPHGSQPNWSTEHSKVTSGSLEWNVKMASISHVCASGLMSRKTSGGSFGGSAS